MKREKSSWALGNFVIQFMVWKCPRFACPAPALSGQSYFPSFIDIHDAWDWAICSLSVPTTVHPPVMKIYGHVWRPWRLITISRRNSGPSICRLRAPLNYLSCLILQPRLHIRCTICVLAHTVPLQWEDGSHQQALLSNMWKYIQLGIISL